MGLGSMTRPTRNSRTECQTGIALRNRPGIAVLLAAACILAGCKPVGPNYQRPAYTAPPAYKEAGGSAVTPPPATASGVAWQPASPSDGLLRGKWWEIYNDSQLNQLEDHIATSNQTLHAAYETYLAAQQQVGIARSAFSPSVSAVPGYNHARVSVNRPQDVTGTGVGSNYNDITLEGVASWEPDFWGAIRRSVEAAKSSAQASAADLANVDLSLHAELAEDYFELRGLDTQTRLLDSDIKDLENQLDLTQRRLAGGIGTGSDVAQAQTQLDTTRAQLVDVGIARTEYEHAIGAIANIPLPGFSIAPDPLLDMPLPHVPLGVPSQLLQRRPDISVAERRAQAANAQVGVAIAAFYPTITIAGGGGFESTNIGTLIQGPSALWSLGAQASQLLIDGGRRHAVTAQARDNFEASASTYKQSVISAFQEVEDKLSDLRILEQEDTAEKAAVADAQKSLDISNTRYKGGVTTYLEVITQETILIQNQRTQANLQALQFGKTVELIRALGGGWDTTQLP